MPRAPMPVLRHRPGRRARSMGPTAGSRLGKVQRTPAQPCTRSGPNCSAMARPKAGSSVASRTWLAAWSSSRTGACSQSRSKVAPMNQPGSPSGEGTPLMKLPWPLTGKGGSSWRWASFKSAMWPKLTCPRKGFNGTAKPGRGRSKARLSKALATTSQGAWPSVWPCASVTAHSSPRRSMPCTCWPQRTCTPGVCSCAATSCRGRIQPA